jgi:endonuclease III
MTEKKTRLGSKDLGLDLAKGTDLQVFKWLIACQLFGARISQDIAATTFRTLDKAGVLRPDKLAGADWQTIVNLLVEGGYRRYDESTARELISIGQYVLDQYGGHITRLPKDADKTTVSQRLQEFKGIGPKSAEIFLREIAPLWKL